LTTLGKVRYVRLIVIRSVARYSAYYSGLFRGRLGALEFQSLYGSRMEDGGCSMSVLVCGSRFVHKVP